MASRVTAATATEDRASAHPASKPTAVTAWTAHHVKTVARVKSVNPVPSASQARMPIWAAFASASLAHALPRPAVSLIRCAPASTPCARATAAARVAVVVVVAAEAAPARATRAALPILCARTTAEFVNTPRAAFGVTPLGGGRCLGPAEPDLRHLWMGTLRSGDGWGDTPLALVGLEAGNATGWTYLTNTVTSGSSPTCRLQWPCTCGSNSAPSGNVSAE